MPKLNYKYEFPCGYKFELIVNGLFLTINSNDKDLILCPIHKDKCKKEITKRLEELK